MRGIVCFVVVFRDDSSVWRGNVPVHLVHDSVPVVQCGGEALDRELYVWPLSLISQGLLDKAVIVRRPIGAYGKAREHAVALRQASTAGKLIQELLVDPMTAALVASALARSDPPVLSK